MGTGEDTGVGTWEAFYKIEEKGTLIKGIERSGFATGIEPSLFHMAPCA